MLSVKVLCILITVSASCAFELNIDSRIVGGTDAAPGAYPYQVSLQTPSAGHFCGGSILSENWVVSAAHCVYNIPNPKKLCSGRIIITAVTGTIYLNNKDNEYRVCQVIAHENFVMSTTVNDIAVLKVRTPMNTQNANIQPVALPVNAFDVISAPQMAIVTGWGLTNSNNSTAPNTMQVLSIQITSFADCQNAWGTTGYSLTEAGNICALNNNNGMCNGDSGGPLVSNGILYGLTSWGDMPCGQNNPDVFTNVPHFLAWINGKTGL